MAYTASVKLRVSFNPFLMRILYFVAWMTRAGIHVQIGKRKKDFFLLSPIWIDWVAKYTVKAGMKLCLGA